MKRLLLIALTLMFSVMIYGQKKFKITVEPAVGGTISVSDSSAYEGDTILLTQRADIGFIFEKWRIYKTDDSSTTVSVIDSSFIMPAFDVTVTATFKAKEYNIYIIQPYGGIISASASSAYEGDTILLTQRAHNCFVFKEWNIYKTEDSLTKVPVIDSSFIMPAFDVTVTAVFYLSLPRIMSDIITPDAICSGETLYLQAPEVQNATDQGWQIAADANFNDPRPYKGQILTFDYDGWYLRFWASNEAGVVYSNVVRITVIEVPDIVIIGDVSVCHLQTVVYQIEPNDGWQYQWTITNGTATPQGNKVSVLWDGTSEGYVKVEATNLKSNCTVVAEKDIAIFSTVMDNEVNSIAVKKNSMGQSYILIYQHPADGLKFQWYRDDVPIEGATGQYYYVSGGVANGSYKVYVSYKYDDMGQLYCGAFTKPCIVSDNDKKTFAIYPNPAESGSEISIERVCDVEAVVTIYSLDGKMVHKQLLNGNSVKLKMKLSHGVYVVKLIDNWQNMSVEKIVIK